MSPCVKRGGCGPWVPRGRDNPHFAQCPHWPRPCPKFSSELRKEQYLRIQSLKMYQKPENQGTVPGSLDRAVKEPGALSEELGPGPPARPPGPLATVSESPKQNQTKQLPVLLLCFFRIPCFSKDTDSKSSRSNRHLFHFISC